MRSRGVKNPPRDEPRNYEQRPIGRCSLVRGLHPLAYNAITTLWQLELRILDIIPI